MANENMNISVGRKKKMTFIPVVIILIIIIIGVVGIIVSDRNDDGEVNGSTQSTNVSDASAQSAANDNIGVAEEELRKNEMKAKLDKVYQKYSDWSWASKGAIEKVNLFYLKDGKIIYENSADKQELNFTYGTPKYIRTMLNGGSLSYLIVITEEGEVYNIDLSSFGDYKFNFSNLSINKVEFKDKIVDVATNITSAAYLYVPFYLTENVAIVNKDGKTYEEIVKNHVLFIGTTSVEIYVNSDKTLELLRNYESNDYMYIIDDLGEKVKAKAVFKEISTRWTGVEAEHYYVIDEENDLLDFDSSTLFVARIYQEAKGKKVKTVKYDESKNSLTVEFEDDSSIQMSDIYSYNDLSKLK
ncbi:MAG: hypothetical protein IJ809_00260 [Clostridia bacterium]|nr:hypothetical protein [Clostridia bacterium]